MLARFCVVSSPPSAVFLPFFSSHLLSTSYRRVVSFQRKICFSKIMSISGTELVSSKFVDLASKELISLHRLYALKMIFDRNLENRFFFILFLRFLSILILCLESNSVSASSGLIYSFFFSKITTFYYSDVLCHRINLNEIFLKRF